MKEVLEYLLKNPAVIVAIIAAVASVAAAVITGVISCRVKSKEAELEKELNNVIALNNRLTHIMSSRFDYEFEIYKDMSKVFFLLTSSLNTYYSQGFRKAHSNEQLKYQKAEELLQDVIKAYYKYRDTLYMVGAFIPEEQFDEFEQFMKLCFSQYQLFYNAQYYEEYDKMNRVEEKANENDIKITKTQTMLIKRLRSYLLEYMPISQVRKENN